MVAVMATKSNSNKFRKSVGIETVRVDEIDLST